MAIEEALAPSLDAAEWEAPPIIASVGHEEPAAGTQVSEGSLSARCEFFFRQSSEDFSNLGLFTLRHEIARVRLMTGDFVGIDYGEGVFKAIEVGSSPENEDDQKAERLRWIAALASVAQKSKTMTKSIDSMSPEEAAEHELIKAYDMPLKDMVRTALALHFELRVDKTDEEIVAEIRTHFDQLIEKEAFIYRVREILAEAVFVESDEERAEAKKRFEHSLHKKQRLQVTLRGLLERGACV